MLWQVPRRVGSRLSRTGTGSLLAAGRGYWDFVLHAELASQLRGPCPRLGNWDVSRGSEFRPMAFKGTFRCIIDLEIN